MYLHFLWLGNGDRLAIAHARDVADEMAFLIGHPDLNGGNLVVVADADGLCPKQVAFPSARYEHDAVADAEGELLADVHQGCDGEVCQREQRATLAYVPAIEVVVCHQHLSHGVFRVYLRNPATSVGCKAICAIQ